MDRITNPKDSNVCRTTGYNDNPTPSGSYYPDSCFCYKYAIPSELADISLQNLCFKHLIPSEFNFDNPKFHFTDIITNPKDSNVCRTTGNKNNSTPSGSHTPGPYFGYKHAIPSELVDNSVKNLCYKHIIPTEFCFGNPNSRYTNKTTNPKDSNICRTMGNYDDTTPTGSDVPDSCFCYKHSIPSELADVPESCFCYKHAIPLELLDITVQNIYFKHVIHSEFNFDNPKFYFTNGIANPEDSNVYKTTGYKDKTTNPKDSYIYKTMVNTDKTTNPKDSYIYRTMGNNDNSTPAGSNIPGSCLCYKHVIPSEFNFDNPKFHFTDIITNPKDSNVCRTTGYNDNPTPSGSYYPDSCFCYKYAIPSELADISLQNLCFKHLIPSEFNFDNPKFHFTDIITNPKDSNVCRTTGNKNNSTPSGSHTPGPYFGYKHAIPSELVDNSVKNLCYKHIIPTEFCFGNPNSRYTNKTTNPKDSNICRTMGNYDDTTPTGSDVPDSCFCYKHSIPSELADVPESCFCYKHAIPLELLDITVQNIYFKHVIHSEFNFDNPKFYFTNRIANPEDSNVYKTMGNNDKTTNPEDSYIYKTTGYNDNPTPSGSNILGLNLCYKHVIPSEFNFDNPKFHFTDIITNPKDSNICRTMGNTDKITNPKDSYIYRTMGNNDNSTPAGSNIPSELVDNFLPNLHSKHAIPMGLLNNKHKSKC